MCSRNESMHDSRNKTMDDLIVQFIADSGATEQLSKTKLVFKTLNTDKREKIKCASKNGHLETLGVGKVQIEGDNGENLVLEDVLYSEDLSENLLSLKQFVDQRLKIYLENKVINIYDPISNKNLITEIYQSPFWQVKLKIAQDENSTIEKQKIFALISNNNINHEYNTRNNKGKLISEDEERNTQSEGKRESETVIKSVDNSNKIESNKGRPAELVGNQTIGNGNNILSNLVYTLKDRKIHSLDENTELTTDKEIEHITVPNLPERKVNSHALAFAVRTCVSYLY